MRVLARQAAGERVRGLDGDTPGMGLKDGSERAGAMGTGARGMFGWAVEGSVMNEMVGRVMG